MRKNSKKGQLEVVIVLGVVIVGILVVVLSTQQSAVTPTSPIPSDISAEQQLVQDFVITALRSEAHKLLVNIETHGGYLDDVPDNKYNTTFLYQEIPIWQACAFHDQDIPPVGKLVPDLANIENSFATNLSYFILNGGVIDNITLSGKNVTFFKNSLNINSVNILDNEIKFEIELATMVDGFPITEPYVFSIPTKFGRIYKFAKDFAAESANSRFFEVFVRSYLETYNNPPDHPLLNGVLVACGETHEMLGVDVDLATESSITASSILNLWSTPGLVNDWPIIPSIPDVNGNTYEDLEHPDFYLQSGFLVSGSNGFNIENNVPTFSGPPCTAACPPAPPPTCGPLSYWVAFDIKPWSVIVRVNDPDGAFFNFAVFADIDIADTPANNPEDFIADALNDLGDCEALGFNKMYWIGNLEEEVPEPSPLEFFDATDNMCYYDKNAGGTFNDEDILWVDSEGCGTGPDDEGDTVVYGVAEPGVSGIQVDSSRPLKYHDQNGNSIYETQEKIYLLLADVGIACGDALQQLRDLISKRVTLSNVRTALGSVKSMVAGNCGL